MHVPPDYILGAVNALLGVSNSSGNPGEGAGSQDNNADDRFGIVDERILYRIECRDTASSKSWFRCPICKGTWVENRIDAMLHALRAKNSCEDGFSTLKFVHVR